MTAARSPELSRAIWMREHHHTLEDIGQCVGVSTSTISKWFAAEPKICLDCDAQLRDPSSDGLCGFCRAEKAEARDRAVTV